MRKTEKAIVLLILGGLIYVAIEMLFRGRSHWSMFLVGGAMFLTVGSFNEFVPWEMPMWTQGLLGAVTITGVEFAAGCILNGVLGLNVWDYSNMPFNLLGQICLPFSVAWFFLAIVAVVIDDWARHLLFGEEKPHYRFW